MAPTTRSTAKRRRLEASQPQNALPEDVFLRCFLFLDRRDLGALCQVSTSVRGALMNGSGSSELWGRQVVRSCGPVMRDVWESLRGTTRRASGGGGSASDERLTVINDATQQQQQEEPLLTDPELWIKVLRGRENALGLESFEDVVRRYQEFYNVAWFLEPGVDLSLEIPDWYNPLFFYSFVVHAWDAEGKKHSRAVEDAEWNECQSSGSETTFSLELGKSNVGKIIRSGKFQAIEIEACFWAGGVLAKSSVIYSSFNPLVDAYGGPRYTEYSALSWFEREGDSTAEEAVSKGWIPERYDWLPFVSSPTIKTTKGDTSLVISMEWRRRGGNGRIGDKYEERTAYLKIGEIITFLANRFSLLLGRGGSRSSGDEPHCHVPMEGGIILTREYSPRPVSAYSFLVDISDAKDSTRSFSFFVESLDEDDWDISFPYLSIEIPPAYYSLLPSPEGFLRTDEFDNTITVYVIDRRTGKQAKVYESGANCSMFIGEFCLGEYFAFERYAALTKYSIGPNSNGIPAPSTDAVLKPIWENDPDMEDLGPPSLRVMFHFHYYRVGVRSGEPLYQSRVDFSEKDVLTFLEHGLVYE